MYQQRQQRPSGVDGTVHLITHHKAGTVAGMSLYLGLCNQTPTAAKLVESAFWSSKRPGVFERVCAACEAVTFHYNGLPATVVPRMSPRDSYIHLARNPVEACGAHMCAMHISALMLMHMPMPTHMHMRMLLMHARAHVQMLASGYLYHRACSEKWTYDPTNRSGLRYPAAPHALLIPGRVSYCTYLQRASLRDGLAMELRRTRYAEDGIGNMMALLPVLHEPRALTLCLHNLSSALPMLSARFQRNLTIVDLPAHHTNHTPEVMSIARDVWRGEFGAQSTELCREAGEDPRKLELEFGSGLQNFGLNSPNGKFGRFRFTNRM